MVLLVMVSSFNLGTTRTVGSAASYTPQSDGRTAKDGVFTEVQSERGAEIYRRSCRKCHYADLLGDGSDGTPGEVAPPLAGPGFAVRWHGETIGELFRAIKRAMPQDRPGTLEADAVVDLISYLLKMNDFPTGNSELPATEETLDLMMVEVTP